MNKTKERAKGFIAGVLLMILLSSSVAVLANTAVLDVVFSVNHVVVNGNRLNLSEEERPFTSGGRTFLPARAISEALGQPVEWDGSTGTIYIGSRITTLYVPPQPTPVPLLEAASPFEQNPPGRTGLHEATVHMLGQPYPMAIRSGSSMGGNTYTQWSQHNLNSQFTTLSGTIGRIDGTPANTASISFIGDGRTLATFTVDGNTMPTDISVDVSGVSVLRIQMDGVGFFGIEARIAIAFANATLE
ncbi:MAG: stalk domain-containing protein [Defluviitaleaceae bacterium]|nr:stalk domain-containing protein [Defluviitaleaceae bacterium]